MPNWSTISRLSPIAADQWGLVTRRQADIAGVPRATLDRLLGRGDFLERVAHGVYHLRMAPIPDHLALRAAWLQLAPEVAAWDRRPEQGVVSHRSAAALYGIGDLPADRHDFTLPARRQSRRTDVRLHQRPVEGHWIRLRGLLVTRPARITDDLIRDDEGPEAIAQVVADAMRAGAEATDLFIEALAPHSSRFGLPRDDGRALLRWFLGLVGHPSASRPVDQARRAVPG